MTVLQRQLDIWMGWKHLVLLFAILLMFNEGYCPKETMFSGFTTESAEYVRVSCTVKMGQSFSRISRRLPTLSLQYIVSCILKS